MRRNITLKKFLSVVGGVSGFTLVMENKHGRQWIVSKSVNEVAKWRIPIVSANFVGGQLYIVIDAEDFLNHFYWFKGETKGIVIDRIIALNEPLDEPVMAGKQDE